MESKKCCINVCSTKEGHEKDVFVKFHQFPSLQNEIEKWITGNDTALFSQLRVLIHKIFCFLIAACKLETNFKPKDATYICSRHFKPEDYTTSTSGYHQGESFLKNSKEPSIFPWSDSPPQSMAEYSTPSPNEVKVDFTQFPTEILEKIFKFVPNHESTSLTCKKFHEISCSVRFFNLLFCSVGERYEVHFARYLDSDDVFSMMMKSNRRFKRLRITNDDIYDFSIFRGLRLQRLTQVLARFGKDIEKLAIDNIELPSNFVQLLNFMPKLNKIYLGGIQEYGTKVVEGPINLHKLTRFQSQHCSAAVLRIFNNLPPNVLTELFMVDIYRHPLSRYGKDTVVKGKIKLFANQNSIKKKYIVKKSE
jgi:THAP domain